MTCIFCGNKPLVHGRVFDKAVEKDTLICLRCGESFESPRPVVNVLAIDADGVHHATLNSDDSITLGEPVGAER
jgi:hypothetical protein